MNLILSNLPDIFGILGVSIVIVYYLKLQTGRIKANTFEFSVANAFGSIFVIVSLLFDFNVASFMIEMFWLMISCYGIFKAIRN